MNYEKPFLGDVNLPYLEFKTERSQLICAQPAWATLLMGIAGVMFVISPIEAFQISGGMSSGMIRNILMVFQGPDVTGKCILGFILLFGATMWLHFVLFCFDKLIRNPKIVVEADGVIHLYQGLNRSTPHKTIRWHEIESLTFDKLMTESSSKSSSGTVTIKRNFPAIFLKVKNEKLKVLCVGTDKDAIYRFYEETQKRAHKAS